MCPILLDQTNLSNTDDVRTEAVSVSYHDVLALAWLSLFCLRYTANYNSGLFAYLWWLEALLLINKA